MRTKNLVFSVMALLFFSSMAFAQVRGTVVDEFGPIPGVNISVVGGEESTVTDDGGNFTIMADVGDQLLVVNPSTLAEKSVSVNKLNLGNISIADATITLGPVVATALGIDRDEKALGYSNVKVTGEQLTEVTNSNPFESLSGKVPGVDISAPLQPGSSPKIISRGFSSLVSNQPLLIIDGTPTLNVSSSSTGVSGSFDGGTSFSDLDPNNIESMNFLKGAAATALYGSKGANGVIIITTKKGKDKLTINYSSSFSVSEVARVPHIQYEFGQGWNGEGYSTVAGEGPGSASNENGSWGPRFDGNIRAWGRIVNGAQQIKRYVGLEDNIRDFYNYGYNFTNSLSLSGGGKHTDAAFTLSNTDNDGINPGNQDHYIRNNFGFNGGLTYDKMRIRITSNYTHKKQSAVPTGQGDDAGFGKSLFQELLQMPTDISIVDLEDQSNIFNTPSYFFTPYASNPYVTLMNNNIRIKKDRFFGNANFSYDLMSNLIANFQVGADIDNEYVKRWGGIVNYLPDSPQALANANGVVGAVSEYQRQSRLYDTYASLAYSNELSDKFDMSVVGGGGFTEYNGNALSVKVTNLDVPGFYEISNSAARPTVVQNDYLERYYYLFGQAEFDYNKRLYLTLTARNDWSSTLPQKANSFFYPSAALSGVVLDGRNFLKVRGSWSQVGNSAPRYNVFATAGQAVNDGYFGNLTYPFGDINAYEIYGQIENNNLKNELTTEVEFGVEGNLFRKRVEFDVTYYNRKTEDMLLALPVSRATGYSTIYGNFADIRNSGIEVMLSTVPVKTKDFRWNFTYTFAKNDGKVLHVKGDSEITINSAYNIDYKFVEGEDIGTFYAVTPLVNDLGQYVVDPNTGFYEVTTTQQKIGTSERDFVMGFSNNFTYKNISLSFNVDWKQGGDFYSYTKRLSHFDGNGIETIYNDRNPFIIPNSVNAVYNDNGEVVSYVENTTPVSFANITNFYNVGNNKGNEYTHVIDKTFVRLRDVSLTYTLPKKWFEKIGIDSMSFTAFGKNLFLWTPAENPYVDPEASNYGNDIRSELGEFAANPTERMVGGIFKLKF